MKKAEICKKSKMISHDGKSLFSQILQGIGEMQEKKACMNQNDECFFCISFSL